MNSGYCVVVCVIQRKLYFPEKSGHRIQVFVDVIDVQIGEGVITVFKCSHRII